MFSALTIKNFQAHEKLKITFDPAVTVIVGSSDVGKSAVLRALEWVCTNRPAGDAFIRDGGDAVKVTLHADGHIVRRTKGKGKNSYSLDGASLKAFGVDVPEGIAKLLNVDEVNFQGQHDAPYWFSRTPGEVARSLNSVINLGIIDSVLAHLNSEGRALAGRIAVCGERLAAARQRKEELRGVRQEDHKLQEVEALADGLAAARAKRTQLTGLVQEGLEHTQGAENAAELQSAAARAETLGTQWAELAQKRGELAAMVEKAARYANLAELKVPDIDPVVCAAAALQIKQDRTARLRRLVQECDSLWARYCNAKRIADEDEKLLTERLGAQCPLCGSLIKS